MRMSLWSIVAVFGAFLSMAVLPIACTDEGEAISGFGPGAGAASAAAPAAASGNGGAGGTGSGMGGGTSGSGMDSGLPDGALEQCMMEAMGAACSVCACNSCLVELTACQMDPGCVAIRECAQLNGCTGAACLGPCMMEISMYPMSVGAASTLSTCVETNCATDCAPADAGDAGDGG